MAPSSMFKCCWAGCPSVSATKHELADHLCSIHANTLLCRWKDCDNALSLTGGVNSTGMQHLRLHAQIARFKCSHCEKRFAVKKQLQKHETTHLTGFSRPGPMEFEDDEERDWSSPPRPVERPPSPALSALTTLTDSAEEDSLSSEESDVAPAPKVQPTSRTAHTSVRLLRCRWSPCSKTFADGAALLSHLEDDHVQPQPRGRAKCGWSSCRRLSERRWEVRRHVQAHVRDSVGYACTICGDGSFTNNSALTRHVNKVHGGVASGQPSGTQPNKRSREEVGGDSAPKRPRIDQRPSPSPPRLAPSPAAGMEQHGIVPSLPASTSASLPSRPMAPSHTENDPISRPQIQRMMEEYFEREVQKLKKTELSSSEKGTESQGNRQIAEWASLYCEEYDQMCDQ